MLEANSENANIPKPSLSSMKHHSDRKMTIPLVCSTIQKTSQTAQEAQENIPQSTCYYFSVG